MYCEPAGTADECMNPLITAGGPAVTFWKVADAVLMPPTMMLVVVPPAGNVANMPLTSQSPAVREMLVQLAATPELTATPVPVFTTNSPTLPEFALLFVVVPTMPAVWLGVIAPVAVKAAAFTVPVKVGEALKTATPVPVSSDSTPASWAEVVDANCDRLPLVSAKAVPHDRPVLVVYCSALFAVLQLGTAKAAGAALDPVKLPSTRFAAIGARALDETAPQVGTALGPLETMACPAVEPVGLSNCTGVVVAAMVAPANSARKTAISLRMVVLLIARELPHDSAGVAGIVAAKLE